MVLLWALTKRAYKFGNTLSTIWPKAKVTFHVTTKTKRQYTLCRHSDYEEETCISRTKRTQKDESLLLRTLTKVANNLETPLRHWYQNAKLTFHDTTKTKRRVLFVVTAAIKIKPVSAGQTQKDEILLLRPLSKLANKFWNTLAALRPKS